AGGSGGVGGAAVAAAVGAATVTLGGADVRPPSIPLAVRSPYLSTWLPATSLTAATPQFWNGATRGFVGLAVIDGHAYAWAGQPVLSSGASVTPMTAVSTEVTATRSVFTASAGGVELVAEWLSPVEPGNLQLQSSPFTLLTVAVGFTDGNSHDVQVYADITGEWASSDESALINWQTTSDTTGRYWTVGLQSPNPLSENDQMANWGTVVWAATRSSSLTYQSGYSVDLRSQFAATGNLLDRSDSNLRAINDQQPAFAFAFDFGTGEGSTSFALGHVRTPLISYGQSATPLLPLWTQYWSGWQPMAAAFLSGAASARTRAQALDQEVQQAATSAAGSGYAAACALALRQCYGGTELAIGTDGSPWLLGKEISSDGDTNTVDIFDQAFLAWLWMDPDLIPLVMAPILDWCASSAWQDPSYWGTGSPYCVHDLGVYPVATGRVPGNGEQMPVEESAGMLIMAAAYARAVGASAATPFLSKWQLLWTQWANYLLTQVPFPSEQLTTDDWAPEHANLVNLGIKAIIGLAAAAQIATILGDSTNASTWSSAATGNVGTWQRESTDTSGNYLNLYEGGTGTWSCLYNAYYQMVIDESLVTDSVASMQASFYPSQLTTYGMPLESDVSETNKVAWLFYLAAWLSSYPIAGELMTRNIAYINDTPSLVPYGDRYNTSTGVEASGVEAHPTLGAVFAILAASGPAYAGTEQAASDPADPATRSGQSSASGQPTAQAARAPGASHKRKVKRKTVKRKPRKRKAVKRKPVSHKRKPAKGKARKRQAPKRKRR
ncbi:MAG TPA: DUF5127 domain-containing protein, partial [Solirubrobacteraceae bacterium]|nr:DUF5127 domain-containing protein [Solirubrobacteraceae bacterium]